jgi:hypothetical protein
MFEIHMPDHTLWCMCHAGSHATQHVKRTLTMRALTVLGCCLDAGTRHTYRDAT